MLGNWIVSQRAFKEIAIKYGLEARLSREEVIDSGMATKSKVINNETEHGNTFSNRDDDEWAIFYTPRIKERFNIK